MINGQRAKDQGANGQKGLIIHNSEFKVQNSKFPIDWDAVEAQAADLLSRYLQFDTTNPPGNEAPAIEFLAGLLRQHGFEPEIMESAPGRANLIARLPAATTAAAPPCILYSHADVVPANPARWSHPPFCGHIAGGYVWGRGALDNKGQGIIFLQALTLLKQHAIPLNRDIIFVVAADEEAAGRFGADWLVQHRPDLLKAEYVWNEGGIGLKLPGPGGYLYQIAVAEKEALTVKLTAQGVAAHASVPQPNSPPDRLVRALNRIQWQQQASRLTPVVIQMLKALAPGQPYVRARLFAHADNPVVQLLLLKYLENDPVFAPLVCNSINLTMLHSGQTSNVIPATAEARLDIRLLPGENIQAVLAGLRSVMADPELRVEIEEQAIAHPPSPADSAFFCTLAQTLRRLGPPGLVLPFLTPGATDSRYWRRAGLKAYGFVPMLLSAQELSRIHSADEQVSTANLRWGVQVVFETLANL
jgi:acetylornithine deacetylase/succinyl-diaminopimelate desuccinylase-like protein